MDELQAAQLRAMVRERGTGAIVEELARICMHEASEAATRKNDKSARTFTLWSALLSQTRARFTKQASNSAAYGQR